LEVNKKIKSGDKVSLTIYALIVLASILAEYITYEKDQAYHGDYFSVVIGLVGYFGIYMHSQRIIQNNSFQQFAIIGFAIFVVSMVKQALTNYNLLPLFAAGLPLLFVGYFRVLTYLFYRDYPNATKKPIIIYANKFGQANYDGKENGYKPPIKERVYSLLLFMGFMAFSFGLILLLKNITT